MFDEVFGTQYGAENRVTKVRYARFDSKGFPREPEHPCQSLYVLGSRISILMVPYPNVYYRRAAFICCEHK